MLEGALNHESFQQDEATQVTVPEGATAGSVIAIELPQTPPDTPKAGVALSLRRLQKWEHLSKR